MPIQDQLAYSLNRNDQQPNRLLAQKLADTNDSVRLKELIDFLESEPLRRYQMDGMLVLAYIGEQSPEMIAPYAELLIDKLSSSINRVIFGSMIALSKIANLIPDLLYKSLPKILDAMDSGTVVTRDHGYRILIVLYQNSKYQEDVFLLILEQLMKAPSNQLGQYTEHLLLVLNIIHKKELTKVLEERMQDITNQYHLNRLKKNLKKLHKI